MDFYRYKIYLKNEIGLTLIYLNEIFPMKTSDFEIYILVENYDKKNVEKCQNLNNGKNLIVSNLSNISVLNLIGHSSQSIIPSEIYCPSKSVMVESGHFRNGLTEV